MLMKFFLAIVLMYGFLSAECRSQVDFDVSKVLRAWEEYEQLFSQKDFSANVLAQTRRTGRDPEGNSSRTLEFQVFVSRSGQVVTDKEMLEVWGANHRYHFELMRYEGDGKYIADEVQALGDVVEVAGKYQTGEKQGMPFKLAWIFLSPMRYGSWSCSTILSDPSFVARNVSVGENEYGQETVTIEFEAPGVDLQPGDESIAGSLTFLPDFHWLISDSEFKHSFEENGKVINGVAVCNNRIKKINGVALPVSLSDSRKFSDGTRIDIDKAISGYSFEPIDSSKFYLSGYGIAEPVHLQPWYLRFKWYLIATLCGMVAFYMVISKVRSSDYRSNS